MISRKEEITLKLKEMGIRRHPLGYAVWCHANSYVEVNALLNELWELEKEEQDHCMFCEQFCGNDYCPFAKQK